MALGWTLSELDHDDAAGGAAAGGGAQVDQRASDHGRRPRRWRGSRFARRGRRSAPGRCGRASAGSSPGWSARGRAQPSRSARRAAPGRCPLRPVQRHAAGRPPRLSKRDDDQPVDLGDHPGADREVVAAQAERQPRRGDARTPRRSGPPAAARRTGARPGREARRTAVGADTDVGLLADRHQAAEAGEQVPHAGDGRAARRRSPWSGWCRRTRCKAAPRGRRRPAPAAPALRLEARSTRATRAPADEGAAAARAAVVVLRLVGGRGVRHASDRPCGIRPCGRKASTARKTRCPARRVRTGRSARRRPGSGRGRRRRPGFPRASRGRR